MMDSFAVGHTLRNKAFVATTAHVNPICDITLLRLVSQPACVLYWPAGAGALWSAESWWCCQQRTLRKKHITSHCLFLHSCRMYLQTPVLAYRMAAARWKGRVFLPQSLCQSIYSLIPFWLFVFIFLAPYLEKNLIFKVAAFLVLFLFYLFLSQKIIYLFIF